MPYALGPRKSSCTCPLLGHTATTKGNKLLAGGVTITLRREPGYLSWLAIRSQGPLRHQLLEVGTRATRGQGG